ncbi:hypothetical protein [Streptomyces goshikiensis]|uniref:hypothetical protein n=1 Tax=Streptomyces goshikiensis TaxID=1942 RepID=UPI0036C903F9
MAFTDSHRFDWMDRDNSRSRRTAELEGRPIEQVDPLLRLRRYRSEGVRAARERARQKGRALRVACYAQGPVNASAALSDSLGRAALALSYDVRGELCLDSAGPARVEYRPGLCAAQRLLRRGFADGLVTPSYQHISTDLGEYQRFLEALAARGWFVALVRAETDR